jgi:hypothetical protein
MYSIDADSVGLARMMADACRYPLDIPNHVWMEAAAAAPRLFAGLRNLRATLATLWEACATLEGSHC